MKFQHGEGELKVSNDVDANVDTEADADEKVDAYCDRNGRMVF